MAGEESYVDDDELGGLDGGEAYDDVDSAEVDVLLGHGGGVAADEVGLGWARANEGSLEEEGLEDVFDGQAELSPESGGVGLEGGEAGGSSDLFLDEAGEARGPVGGRGEKNLGEVLGLLRLFGRGFGGMGGGGCMG